MMFKLNIPNNKVVYLVLYQDYDGYDTSRDRDIPICIFKEEEQAQEYVRLKNEIRKRIYGNHYTYKAFRLYEDIAYMNIDDYREQEGAIVNDLS